jgi:hypothetical protein
MVQPLFFVGCRSVRQSSLDGAFLVGELGDEGFEFGVGDFVEFVAEFAVGFGSVVLGDHVPEFGSAEEFEGAEDPIAAAAAGEADGAEFGDQVEAEVAEEGFEDVGEAVAFAEELAEAGEVGGALFEEGFEVFVVGGLGEDLEDQASGGADAVGVGCDADDDGGGGLFGGGEVVGDVVADFAGD